MTAPRVTETKPNIQVHIERLVLDGVRLAPNEVPRLRVAFEQEFARLCAATPAAAWSDGALARLDATAVRLAAKGSSAVWGRQIAQSLFSGLVGRSGSFQRGKPSP